MAVVVFVTRRVHARVRPHDGARPRRKEFFTTPRIASITHCSLFTFISCVVHKLVQNCPPHHLKKNVFLSINTSPAGQHREDVHAVTTPMILPSTWPSFTSIDRSWTVQTVEWSRTIEPPSALSPIPVALSTVRVRMKFATNRKQSSGNRFSLYTHHHITLFSATNAFFLAINHFSFVTRRTLEVRMSRTARAWFLKIYCFCALDCILDLICLKNQAIFKTKIFTDTNCIRCRIKIVQTILYTSFTTVHNFQMGRVV